MSVVKKLAADPHLNDYLTELKVMDKLLIALANSEVPEVAKEILTMIKTLPCTSQSQLFNENLSFFFFVFISLGSILSNPAWF